MCDMWTEVQAWILSAFCIPFLLADGRNRDQSSYYIKLPFKYGFHWNKCKIGYTKIVGGGLKIVFSMVWKGNILSYWTKDNDSINVKQGVMDPVKNLPLER